MRWLATTLLLFCAGCWGPQPPGDFDDDGGVSSSSGAGGSGSTAEPVALRYLAINVGNASPQFDCWEYKLCRPADAARVREYIAAWQPDVILLSEVAREAQLRGSAFGGPLLPDGYDGRCGASVDRAGRPAAWDAEGASHEHECIGWKTARVAEVAGSALSAHGRNDGHGQGCNFDFTGFRLGLVVDGALALDAVAIHPDSKDELCRVEEILRYWDELAAGERVIIGGDWNTSHDDELSVPDRFRVNYRRGQHWQLAEHDDEISAEYGFGLHERQLDHAFSSFGTPRTSELPLGSVLGGADGHPRADGGEGLDHRQILVDLEALP